MSDKTTLERLRHLLGEQLGLPPSEESEIDGSTTFRNDLSCDSLDDVELVMACEEEWDIEIQDEDAEKVVTVGDAVNLIDRILKN